MIFLLDTNVLSEARRPEPDRNVLAWLDRLDEDRAFVSVVSLAEIRRGVALTENGSTRSPEWLARDLPERFAGRILANGQEAAFAWGDLMAAAKRRGIGLTSRDGLLAATASAHSLISATRNTRDFCDLGVKLFDPWGA